MKYNQDIDGYYKQRVFIAARKRGITPKRVHALLANHGLPPTLSDVGARRLTGETWHGFPYSYRDPNDFRGITREQGNMLVSYVIKNANQLRET